LLLLVTEDETYLLKIITKRSKEEVYTEFVTFPKKHSIILNIKPEIYNVAVIYNILLAFRP
jgi:hypothetical protein